MGTEETVAQHYTHGALERAVLDALRAAGKDPDRLEPGDLAPVDEFHIGGRQATVDLADKLGVTRGMRLLDIGSGLGGALALLRARARLHASPASTSPRSMSRSRKALSVRTGLAGPGLVPARQRACPALSPAGTFDGAYMLHVGMNIADKAALFAQVRRALKPRGVFGVYDVMREGEGALGYPVPWAASSETSFVESSATYAPATRRRGLRGARAAQPPRVRDHVLPGTARAHARRAARRPSGCIFVMGPTTPQKIANMASAIEAGGHLADGDHLPGRGLTGVKSPRFRGRGEGLARREGGGREGTWYGFAGQFGPGRIRKACRIAAPSIAVAKNAQPLGTAPSAPST